LFFWLAIGQVGEASDFKMMCMCVRSGHAALTWPPHSSSLYVHVATTISSKGGSGLIIAFSLEGSVKYYK
jgi:hypothetical protein